MPLLSDKLNIVLLELMKIDLPDELFNGFDCHCIDEKFITKDRGLFYSATLETEDYIGLIECTDFIKNPEVRATIINMGLNSIDSYNDERANLKQATWEYAIHSANISLQHVAIFF